MTRSKEWRTRRASAFARWKKTKQFLRETLRSDDFEAYVRPLYLLQLVCGEAALLAAPPKRRIVERARNSVALRQAAAQHGFPTVFITRYPTDQELLDARQRYPEIFAFYARGLQNRAETISRMRCAEDSRDRVFAA